MKTLIEIKCPYCQHVQKYSFEFEAPYKPMTLKLCDPDTGGCDRHFGVAVAIEFKIDTFIITPANVILPSNIQPPSQP